MVHVLHTFDCRAVDTFCVEQLTFLKKVSSRCISSSWPWLIIYSLAQSDLIKRKVVYFEILNVFTTFTRLKTIHISLRPIIAQWCLFHNKNGKSPAKILEYSDSNQIFNLASGLLYSWQGIFDRFTEFTFSDYWYFCLSLNKKALTSDISLNNNF